MADLLAPEDLPIHVPGRIVGRSDGLGWRGVSYRCYDYAGQDVVIPGMRDFLLVSYCTGTTPMRRRFDGRWSRAVCGPGVTSLLTRSQASHWHWTEDVNVRHIYLTADFVSNVAREVVGRDIHEVRLADILRTHDPVISVAADTIAAEASQVALGGPLYVDSVARQLVIHLLRRYANVRVKPDTQHGELTAIQQRNILDFIEANLEHNIGLEQLAAQLGMGPCAFSKTFRKTLGVAPYAFVTARRVERARELLARSSKPIKQIAACCGFSDQAHLTRFFKKQYGVPPASFRRNARHNAAGAKSLTRHMGPAIRTG